MTRKKTAWLPREESTESEVNRIAELLASLASLAKKAAQMQTNSDEFGLHAAVGRLIEGVQSLERFVPPLEVLQTESLSHSERQFLELEANLRKACDERGWRLEGVWPSLYVDRGIHILFDEKKRSAIVGGQRLASLAVSEIVRTLTPLVRELSPRGFNSSSFLADLAAAYDDVRPVSGQAPLFDVYRELIIRSQGQRFWRDARSNVFTGMSADQFRARFSRMLEDGPAATDDGRLLRLLPPLKPEDGLYIYQPAESRFGFVGRIEFLRRDEATP